MVTNRGDVPKGWGSRTKDPPTEVMAVIRDIHIGVRDTDTPVIWFETMVSEVSGALQIIDEDKIIAFIREWGVYDLNQLNGKVCWVEQSGNLIKYSRPCKIGREAKS